MRVAVFASRQTPKWVIYSALDALHAEHGIDVIGWTDNQGGQYAVEWAESRPGAHSTIVSGVKSPGTRLSGQYFDSRAACITVFKLYQPDRCVVFASSYWIASGVGKLICQQAEKWAVPVHFYEPNRDDTQGTGNRTVWKEPFVCRVIELCGKKSPLGKVTCNRFKGHPGAWHHQSVGGVRGKKFWLP